MHREGSIENPKKENELLIQLQNDKKAETKSQRALRDTRQNQVQTSYNKNQVELGDNHPSSSDSNNMHSDASDFDAEDFNSMQLSKPWHNQSTSNKNQVRFGDTQSSSSDSNNMHSDALDFDANHSNSTQLRRLTMLLEHDNLWKIKVISSKFKRI